MSSGRKGPNVVSEAESYTSIDPHVCTKIRMGTEGLSTEDPISVPTLLRRVARDHPDHAALVYQDALRKWTTVTYA